MAPRPPDSASSAALFVRLGVIRAVGSHLENLANYVLILFGAIYMSWGLWRSTADHRGFPVG